MIIKQKLRLTIPSHKIKIVRGLYLDYCGPLVGNQCSKEKRKIYAKKKINEISKMTSKFLVTFTFHKLHISNKDGTYNNYVFQLPNTDQMVSFFMQIIVLRQQGWSFVGVVMYFTLRSSSLLCNLFHQLSSAENNLIL